MALAITLVQISSAYLRYLPFERELSPEITDKLAKSILLWSLAGFVINFFIFSDVITYKAFKMSFSVGWLPYFLISVPIIRKKLPQHVFIFGMQSLWCFMLHATGGGAVASIFGAMSEGFLTLQISFYIAFFLILFPLERKFFINLLATAQFFTNRALRWKISLLPLIKAFLRGK